MSIQPNIGGRVSWYCGTCRRFNKFQQYMIPTELTAVDKIVCTVCQNAMFRCLTCIQSTKNHLHMSKTYENTTNVIR